MINAFSIDVEDWFQVSAFEHTLPREHWPTLDCRVEANMEKILALLESAGAKGTFFTLGWLAERYPAMVRSIVSAGHELASHGYGHQRATDQTRDQFHSDVLRARQVLEDIGGVAVSGYRAPSFSIDASNPWAYDVLVDTGHRYSSSLYPVVHDHYGTPDAPRVPFRTGSGLLEIPISTLRFAGRNFPAGGGGYFRLLPYRASAWALHRVNQHDRQPAIFYLHPWELDPGQPRVQDAPAKARFRHYLNLARTEPRLRRLLTDFRWDRVDRVYGPHLQSSSATRQGGAQALEKAIA